MNANMLNAINNAEIQNASMNENENASLVNQIFSKLYEAVSLVGLELVMFAFAIVVYFLFTGTGLGKAPAKKEWVEDKKPAPRSPKTKVVKKEEKTEPRVEKEVSWRSEEKAESETEKEEKPEKVVDVARHVAMIRAKSKDNDLDGATQVFRNLQASGAPMTPLVYNALLDSCVQCGKVGAALSHFAEMKSQGLVDVVSYNTLLKAHLRGGQLAKARAMLDEMSAAGIKANQVTYNEMLNAMVGVKDRKGMWTLVGDMAEQGMRPNSVTCSIILKSLAGHSAPQDIRRAMDLIDRMSEDMDEVLFASVIEACVRIGQLDLLSQKLQQYAAKGGLAGLTAPTYGSMIKAYGRARDIERVRELWAEMRRRNVRPTSITLGCMVDALVCNSQPEEALRLVEDVRDDESLRDILNTVIYSTLLKGFAQAKQPEKVQRVFEDMQADGIACNTVSYNTMINSNALTGRMARCDELFKDMQAAGVQPDIITFSTLVKGYCMDGDIDKGFAVLKDMTSRGKHEPDEILYNSLLDGCAKQHRVDDALGLIESMAKNNVRPSNFTLSILVKLLGRARRLNQAFQTVEDMCKRFDLQANIHVYTCLLYACFQNRQLPRALKLHDSMITEGGVEPDAKTYAVLARGCVQAGILDKAANVVRAAYRLSPQGLVQPKYAPGVEARVLEEVMAALSTAPNAEKLAVPLLTDLKALGVHVERDVYARAVQTSVSRAGRNNAHPETGAFAQVKGRRNNY
jgi:pentatricopeptide repeat protein